MRENTVRSIWARGGVVVNGWLTVPSSYSAEVMAHQGFDSLVIDMQHGAMDDASALAMLQAISTTSTIPLARAAWNDPSHLMKMLDAGVYGVICPMVNTRAQAEALVGACKYPPRGFRSFGPVRASMYGGDDYFERANDELLVVPMIETAEALENLEEIVTTPGVDAVYVGPADLSVSTGGEPGIDWAEPGMLEAQQKVAVVCARHGVVAGIHTGTPEYALKMVEAGFRFVTVGSDSRSLAVQAVADLAVVRKRLPAD